MSEQDIPEFWATCTGFPNYLVSSRGQVMRRGKRVLSRSLTAKGYPKVSLGIKNRCYVHRLVAREFCVGYDESKQVNHRDGNKLNNNMENLEWVTAKENTVHSVTNGLRKYTRKSDV